MQQDKSTNQIVKPNFLYIGAAKAGSSWIYEILREHPEVFVPVAKEIEFFNKHYNKGLDWYLPYFQAGDRAKAVGELCHDYFLQEETAHKIKKHLPDVRLISCLREPVDRTISNFSYAKTLTLAPNASFEAFAFREKVISYSDYYYNLRPYFELFPTDNILILFYDDLKKDPKHFARRIYEFIGVDYEFTPEVLHKKVLKTGSPRWVWLAHTAFRIGKKLRNRGLNTIVGSVKKSILFQKLLYTNLENMPEISEDSILELRALYQKRLTGLPELIGQPLPAGWGYKFISPEAVSQ
ncbi:MAG: sulfotransferase domain-containing protein [Anaerolineae bacterium]|nr:sulfotransferase domain-containing protein [Anaerolineae bacterium]